MNAGEPEASCWRAPQAPRPCLFRITPSRLVMLLETIFSSMEPTQPGVERTALVLMGGGARTAYQAGVLHAPATLLGLQGGADSGPRARGSFPFNIVVGTSAGARSTPPFWRAVPARGCKPLTSWPASGPPCARRMSTSSRCRHGYAQAGLPPR